MPWSELGRAAGARRQEEAGGGKAFTAAPVPTDPSQPHCGQAGPGRRASPAAHLLQQAVDESHGFGGCLRGSRGVGGGRRRVVRARGQRRLRAAQQRLQERLAGEVEAAACGSKWKDVTYVATEALMGVLDGPGC